MILFLWPHSSCPNGLETSNTAPAHPHATSVAVYPALFSFFIGNIRDFLLVISSNYRISCIYRPPLISAMCERMGHRPLWGHSSKWMNEHKNDKNKWNVGTRLDLSSLTIPSCPLPPNPGLRCRSNHSLLHFRGVSPIAVWRDTEDLKKRSKQRLIERGRRRNSWFLPSLFVPRTIARRGWQLESESLGLGNQGLFSPPFYTVFLLVIYWPIWSD